MAAITASDILFKLSVKTGSAGNSLAQADPNASLGKYISTTAISGTTLNNLFDNVSGAENAATTVEYRCIFVHNANAANAYQNAKVWLDESAYSGGSTVEIAIDDIAATIISSASAQADEVATEITAPGAGVGTFSAPTTSGTGLSLGSIPAGYCRAVWIKRTTANVAAKSGDGFVLNITGDTAAA